MGTELAMNSTLSPQLPLPSWINSPVPTDASPNTNPYLPLLPPEIIELILDRVWRFEDQLNCRQVCRWWRNYIVPVYRNPATRLPVKYYLFDPTGWTRFNSDKKVIKRLEFRSCGRTTLREYNPLTETVIREVRYEPNKEKVRETIHDDFKRIHTIWHSDTHETKHWTEFKQVHCAIL
jgi:hypothetical protein